MLLGLDYYNNITVPSFVLCKPNQDRIDVIPCTSKNGKIKFNDYNEISFTTYLYINNKKNVVYDKINELMHVELPEIGRFVINSIDVHSEGTKFEYKECTAVSEEVLLAQKYLELFVINMGTTESIDGVQLYNLSDPSKSLIHLVLEKCPDWTIGHVDNELYTIERCFEVDRNDVYSFLTTEVSEAFECIFDFDTINHIINIYRKDTIGEDTNIHVSYSNLTKEVNISSSTDDIKTCLKITGANELNIREVNMGYDSIYNINYFHSLEYMSQDLYDAFSIWKELWNSKVDDYEELVVQYQKYYNDIYNLESVKMPEDPESKDWTLYGLNPLKEKLAANEQKQAVMIKAGQGEESHRDYKEVYLPCYNENQDIKPQIEIVEKENADKKVQQDVIGQQMSEIADFVDMNNNFTQEQLEELTKYIREDELSSDNYVVTDIMTDSERMDMLHNMLEFGKKELAKVSVPTMQFSMDMINIYSIPEFKEHINLFNPGNYIYVTLRDDYSLKLRLLEIDINFFDNNDFSVTFGNVSKIKGNKIFEDITDVLKQASSVATTVSFNSSNWNKANVESTNIGQILSDGLLTSGKRINTTKSDVVIDDRGIIISNNPNSDYVNDVIFIGGGQIVFSDDNLKTIKTALGRVQYTKDGTIYDDFGLLAQFVIAGFIGGSVIEGNEINNGNGTFRVDSDGNLIATSATIKGTIQADKGYIGGEKGFTIESSDGIGRIYSGEKSVFSSNNAGIYIGTDGISLGKNNPFSVDSDGNLTAKSGHIGGAEIGTTYIKATNGNWTLDNTGVATLKGANINGVAIGSTFGNVSYGLNGTYGNFDNGFYAGSSFGLTGGAENDFQNLVVDSINAKKVLADYITATEIKATYATIKTVNALNSVIVGVGNKVTKIEDDYVTTGTLNAVSAKIDNLIAGDTKCDTIWTEHLYMPGSGGRNYTLSLITIVDSTGHSYYVPGKVV